MMKGMTGAQLKRPESEFGQLESYGQALILADSLMNSTLLLDSSGVILYANQAAQSSLNLSPIKLKKAPNLTSVISFNNPKLLNFSEIHEYFGQGYFHVNFVVGKDSLELLGLMSLQRLADETIVLFFYDSTIEDRLDKKYQFALQQKEVVIEKLNQATKHLTNTIDNLKVMTFVSTCVIDGFSLLAGKVAQKTLPIFLGLGVRQMITGICFLGFMLMKGSLEFTTAEIKVGLAIGILSKGIGFGLISASLIDLPSGIVAIIFAACPVWLFLFQSIVAKSRLTKLPLFFLGISMAFLILALTSHGKIQGSIALRPISMALLGSLFCALGIQIGSLGVGRAVRMMAIEQFTGAFISVAIGLTLSEYLKFNISNVSPESWVGSLFLLIFSLIVSQPANRWLTTVSSPFMATTGFFLSPLIALAIGALIGREQIHLETVLYSLGLLLSVACLHLSKTKLKV